MGLFDLIISVLQEYIQIKDLYIVTGPLYNILMILMFLFCFETVSHIVQANIELSMSTKLDLNPGYSPLPLKAKIKVKGRNI